jgi:hypothetical protein
MPQPGASINKRVALLITILGQLQGDAARGVKQLASYRYSAFPEIAPSITCSKTFHYNVQVSRRKLDLRTAFGYLCLHSNARLGRKRCRYLCELPCRDL